MKIRFFFIVLLLSITSCSLDFNHVFKLEDLKHRVLCYEELPDSVRTLLYSVAVGDIAKKHLLLVNPADSLSFHCENVESIFVSSWIDYVKFIDVDKNLVYKIERKEPYPYIYYNHKLYIPNNYYLHGNRVYYVKYTEYELK